MDAVLKNLASIPCPAGNGCREPVCILQHPRDTETDRLGNEKGSDVAIRRPSPAAVAPATKPARPHVSQPEREAPSPPLKRKAPSDDSLARPPPKGAKTSRDARPSPTAASPAGLPANLGPKPARPTTATPAAGSASPTARPKPGLAVQRRTESLNPRHLKSKSPATHEFRYRVLKMLHEQYERLNKELLSTTDKNTTKNNSADPGSAKTIKKLILSPQELVWKALDDEEKTAVEKQSMYTNVIRTRVITYKKMSVAQWKDERIAELRQREESKATTSRQQQKAAPETTAVPGPPVVIDTGGLTPAQEVEFVRAFLLTPVDGLYQHGYVTAVPTEEEIRRAREGEEAGKGWEACDRCTQRFQVFPGRREEDGALASGGECRYHHGRAYFPERVSSEADDGGGGSATQRPEKQYRCCGAAVSSGKPGCTTAATHVFRTSSPAPLAAVLNFAATPANPRAPRGRAVCFDCEMCFTSRGYEVVRLTATSWPDGADLVDVLVQPVGEIMDLNSRYSGVWPEDMVNAPPWAEEATATATAAAPAAAAAAATAHGESTDKQGEAFASSSSRATSTSTPSSSSPSPPEPAKKRLPIVASPSAARDLLFAHIAPDTPLMGHGLENDLNAMRIVHPAVVDTAILYPHRRGGLPLRNSLRALALAHLGRAIQVERHGADGRPLGHDSGEDARAAGDLVRLRVAEQWRARKGQGWRAPPSKGGEGRFLAPPQHAKGTGKRM